MSTDKRLSLFFAAAGSVSLAISPAVAEDADKDDSADQRYAPLVLPQQAPDQGSTAYAGEVQLGLGYAGDDSYMFGQYNGLNEDEVTLIGNLDWQDFSDRDSYWRVQLSDLGLDTREGTVSWGKSDALRIKVGFDSQQQVRNNSGRTPFRGNDTLVLPGNWVSGVTTGDFSNLQASLHGFEQELQRDKLFMDLSARLGERWTLSSNLSYEEKEGNTDLAGGIYIDGSSADAVQLRAPVDYNNFEVGLGLAYAGQRLHLDGQLGYTEFDNKDDVLTWQNPYSSFGPNVAYPNGTGGIDLAPDSELANGRLTGHYLFSSTTRLQFDASYALATQDQDYLDYSVNPALTVTEPVPQDNFDGEVATTTTNVRLLLQPLRKLSAEVFYKLRDRDYDADRDGYLYIRGDGGNQPDSQFTVYNTNHDLTSQSAGFEASYRLPLRSRLGFEYEYEEVERRNAAVEETQQDSYTLSYRIQPLPEFSTKLELQYADRSADTYNWDQSYYSLLDAQLINATPDNQRYNNHPLLNQYYMSNRERMQARLDFSYLPSPEWTLSLNTLWRDDDFDQSDLGLTDSEMARAHLSASYAATDKVLATVYLGYDWQEANQGSRSFRGGQEKNAFEIYAPLPQASDPAQDWQLKATDHSIAAGLNLAWQLAPDLALELDYSYVDTNSEQDYQTGPGSNLDVSSLPDIETRLHQVQASTRWQVRSDISLQLDYQFYSYSSDDWAWDKVYTDSIQKVLTFGQENPNEDIHYVGVSANYRWQ